MKNKKTNATNIIRLLAIIAIVAVIGFSTASCSIIPDDDGGGGGGTFTLTDIPSKYNGMYAWSMVNIKEVGNLYGGNDVGIAGPGKGIRISNGKVSIPLWIIAPGKDERYKGNDTTKFVICINSSETDAGFGAVQKPSFAAGLTYDQVTFSNGSATKSWNAADEVYEMQ